MRKSFETETPDGITWHCEQEGTGPHIVLVPDAFGDCHFFDKSMSLLAASGFTVTSYDSPGLSRSTRAPPESYTDLTPEKVAGFVLGLLDALGIDVATFWGGSAGGVVALALATAHPARVRNALLHEVPTFLPAPFAAALGRSDDAAWRALGDDCHDRLWRNSPRSARAYWRLPRPWSTAQLRQIRPPLAWSVGNATPMGLYFDNVVRAAEAEIPLTLLRDMHFPYVTAPAEFAEYVARVTRQYL
ncbi:hypothetical protein PG999_004107 [Apiospora kogelbergensis]|uniref:AB hydrolase-1 domain-containing protein n=1 Tax=Apiospora kogelbergensis TaxID=1337665 RepID=A0AAW0R5L8_9PEZI